MSMNIRQIDSNTWALFADETDVGTLTQTQVNQANLANYCEGLKFNMSDQFCNAIKSIGSTVIPIGGALIVSTAGAPQNVGTYGFQFIASGWDRTDNYTRGGTLLINKYDEGIYKRTGATRKFVFLFKRLQWDFRNIPFSPTNG